MSMTPRTTRLIPPFRKPAMKILSVVAAMLLTVCLASAQSTGVDLGDVFKDPANWSVGPEAFVTQYRSLGFRIVDENKAAMSSEKKLLRFLGQEACEARVYFDSNAVRRVEISVYNKGDAGEMGQGEFDALVATTKTKIIELSKDNGAAGKTASPRANYFVKRHQWMKASPPLQLEWAFVEPHRSGGKNVDYNAEYIKVLMVPSDATSGMAAMSGAKLALHMQNTQSIKQNVIREPDGDVWIDNIPMVDQGQKGYCAAATSERVLRYFGLEVDQHQIAQIANTAAEGGTSLEGMAKAITIVGRRFQLDRKDLVSSGTGGSFEGSIHVRVIEQYNTVAKRSGKPEIDWKNYLSNNTVDLQRIWDAMDPAILLTARSNQKQGLTQFLKDIKTYTQQGVPVFWSCLVGMYPEDPPISQKGAFGHIRMIIGWNEKTNEILYSDSWGPAHVLKRMPLENAWAMTKGLFVLKPRNVR